MEMEHLVMRATTFVVTLLLGVAAPAAAQEWIEYQSNQDGFKVDFPGQPTITDSTWTTAQGYVLPARVYSADMGGGHYSMTVVDYAVIDRLGMERSVKCPAGAETCQGQPAGNNRPMLGPGYATADIRDAMFHATLKYLQRDAKVTDYLWNNQDLVSGHELHLTNADQSRTSVAIYMRENVLYILDATVPKGYPEPSLFPQSLNFVDKDGRGVRYQVIYSNEIHGLRACPVPPLAGGGAGGPLPAAPAAPGR
jgi:hypothetical protein